MSSEFKLVLAEDGQEIRFKNLAKQGRKVKLTRALKFQASVLGSTQPPFIPPVLLFGLGHVLFLPSKVPAVQRAGDFKSVSNEQNVLQLIRFTRRIPTYPLDRVIRFLST